MFVTQKIQSTNEQTIEISVVRGLSFNMNYIVECRRGKVRGEVKYI